MPNLNDTLKAIAQRYQAFADDQAHGVSERYEELAKGIARSPRLLEFLATLPVERQQPNLFLAAVRHVCGVARTTTEFEQLVEANETSIRSTMMTRTTQTNEPARCALLLPALSLVEKPLALLEVGASAGLCLLPDAYDYDYGERKVVAADRQQWEPPEFPCSANAQTPIPASAPDIVWRAGLDLNPLDVCNNEQMAWLETLVWPEQQARADRLRKAIALAQHTPPTIHKGNLLKDLLPLAETAPRDAQLVIFHTAVLAYVQAPAERTRFAELVTKTNAIWLSNEAPSIFPEQSQRAPPTLRKGSFLLSLDGEPVAWTGPHGQYIDWFAATPPQ